MGQSSRTALQVPSGMQKLGQCTIVADGNMHQVVLSFKIVRKICVFKKLKLEWRVNSRVKDHGFGLDAKFSIDFQIFQWKCPLQYQNGLALSKMKFKTCLQTNPTRTRRASVQHHAPFCCGVFNAQIVHKKTPQLVVFNRGDTNFVLSDWFIPGCHPNMKWVIFFNQAYSSSSLSTKGGISSSTSSYQLKWFSQFK